MAPLCPVCASLTHTHTNNPPTHPNSRVLFALVIASDRPESRLFKWSVIGETFHLSPLSLSLSPLAAPLDSVAAECSRILPWSKAGCHEYFCTVKCGGEVLPLSCGPLCSQLSRRPDQSYQTGVHYCIYFLPLTQSQHSLYTTSVEQLSETCFVNVPLGRLYYAE